MVPGQIPELRDLTRNRTQLMREVVQHKQRIQKVLEDANVELASVYQMWWAKAGGGCSGRSSMGKPMSESWRPWVALETCRHFERDRFVFLSAF